LEDAQDLPIFFEWQVVLGKVRHRIARPSNDMALSREPREIVSSALPGFFARGWSAAAPG